MREDREGREGDGEGGHWLVWRPQPLSVVTPHFTSRVPPKDHLATVQEEVLPC